MKLNKLVNHIIIPLFLLSLGLAGCSLFEPNNAEKPVARVFNTYLYQSDLEDVIPQGTSKKDSLIIARSYVDTWVRNQLMLNRAQEALSDEQKNVEKKIEEYRSSLLIYSYRQKLLLQKMDTVLKNEDILEYYENNINNFILTSEIVKATFVKVPVTAPNIGSVRTWTRSGTTDDLDKLEKYSITYADKFDMFNNTWIYFKSLMDLIPLTIDQPARFLRYNKNIETSDSDYHYFVHISDYKSEGDITPIELIRNDIKSILLNKRKIEFYNNLEKQVYNEGANRNQFEIY